jgi:hypothetical protein
VVTAASTYGIILWAIPRFRRAESVPNPLNANAFQPASGMDKSRRAPAIAAPNALEKPEPAACQHFSH